MKLSDTDLNVLNGFNDILTQKEYDHDSFIENIKHCSIQTIINISKELNDILTRTKNVDTYYLGLAMIHFDIANYLDFLQEDGITY